MIGVFIRQFCAILGILFSCKVASAQFTVTGQLMQRAEYRNGFGRLIEESQDATFLIGQRARIQAQYDHEKAKLFVSAQDVRIWGSTSQVKETDNFFSIHEAYADLLLHPNWKLKVGRQELNYDNARFLGNLDWALQARAHDFVLAKFEKQNLKLHFGAGYNQAKESLTRQPYSVPNQYKTAQLIWFENQWGKFSGSALLWNNGVEENDQGKLKIRYTQTIGLPSMRYVSGNFILSGFYYYQTGSDSTGRQVKAHNANAQVTWKRIMNEQKRKSFQVTAGFEILTGTSQSATDRVNRSYNPFYGTNHAHNGYMDYFFVGNRFVNSVGLYDFFLRLRYDLSSQLFLSLNTHQVFAASDAVDNGTELNRRLGFETDITIGFLLNDIVSLQGGYSQVWQTETLEYLHGVINPATIQNWAYVMLLIRPNMKNRFVGLVF